MSLEGLCWFALQTWFLAVPAGKVPRGRAGGFPSLVPPRPSLDLRFLSNFYYLGRLDPATPGPCQERREKNSPGKEGKPAPTSPSGAELRVPATKGSRAGT